MKLTPLSRRRIRTLREEFSAAGFQCYLAALPSNIQYLTATHTFNDTPLYLLIPLDSDPVLYVQQVGCMGTVRQIQGIAVETVGRGEKAEDKLAVSISETLARRVGFDELAFTKFRAIRRKLLNVRFEPRATILSKMRQVKDSAEIESIRLAAGLSDIGMKSALEKLRVGLREYEVAAEAEYAMRKRGGEGTAFNTIVASGPRSALPHASCSDRKVRSGDVVIIDLGAKVMGYSSDLTRTVFVGSPTTEHVKVYKLIYDALEAALKSIHVGMKGSEADASARKLVEEEGYGSYFVHGLGHGVGLEVHENPRLAASSEDMLSEGNVVAVEPAVYLPGRFGVRIEDMAVITRRGLRLLTQCEKRVY